MENSYLFLEMSKFNNFTDLENVVSAEVPAAYHPSTKLVTTDNLVNLTTVIHQLSPENMTTQSTTTTSTTTSTTTRTTAGTTRSTAAKTITTTSTGQTLTMETLEVETMETEMPATTEEWTKRAIQTDQPHVVPTSG